MKSNDYSSQSSAHTQIPPPVLLAPSESAHNGARTIPHFTVSAGGDAAADLNKTELATVFAHYLAALQRCTTAEALRALVAEFAEALALPTLFIAAFTAANSALTIKVQSGADDISLNFGLSKSELNSLHQWLQNHPYDQLTDCQSEKDCELPKPIDKIVKQISVNHDHWVMGALGSGSSKFGDEEGTEKNISVQEPGFFFAELGANLKPLLTDCSTSLHHLMWLTDKVLRKIQARQDRQTSCDVFAKITQDTNEFICEWSIDQGLSCLNHALWSGDITPEEQPQIHSLFGLPEFFTSELWQQLHGELNDYIDAGKDFVREYAIKDYKNTLRWLRTKVKILQRSEKGAATAYVAITRDVTEQRVRQDSINREAELERWALKNISYLYSRHNAEAIAETLKYLGEHLGIDRCYARRFQLERTVGYLVAQWNRVGVRAMSVISPDITPRTQRSPYLSGELEAGRGVFIDHISEAPYVDKQFIDYYYKMGAESTMILPAMYKDELAGMVVFHSIKPRHWTPFEKKIVTLLSNAIGMAMFHNELLIKLDESEKRFETAMSAASQGLWELDLQKRTIFLSSTYFAMLGYEAAAFDGPYSTEHSNIHPDDRGKMELLVEKIIAGEITEFNHEVRQIRADGSIAWIRTKAKLVKSDEQGNPWIVMGTDLDITEYKNIELNLQIARQEADAANIAKSEFLARMSHEIRTPMNAIIGLNYLVVQTPLSEEQQSFVTEVDVAAKSLLRIINDILDFSKIEAGKMNLDAHTFNPRTLFNTLCKGHEAECQRKGIDLLLNIADDMPQNIVADSTRLQQVCENLLNNAIKFTTHGEVNVSVEYSATDVGGNLLVDIEDTGIGMSRYQLSLLYDAFSQADGSSTREHGGTGLGLAISKRLVNLMGGDIRADSRLGKGSTFSFNIVCEQYHGECVDTEVVAVEKFGTNKRVLLAEDNVINQKVATGILKKKDIEVVIANNGREAVYLAKAVDENYFDAILMDVEMPVMDGLEATKLIREMDKHKNTLIIAMSAHKVEDKLREYQEAGITTALSKPINPQQLYACLLGEAASQSQ